MNSKKHTGRCHYLHYSSLIIFTLFLLTGTVKFSQVSNLLLQVFDEGRLSDSKGNAVDYRNTVILMTSNLGSDALASITATDADGEDPELAKEAVRKRKTEIATKLVHSHFSPEFVNRLDDVIVFNPLSEPAMLRICNLQLQKVWFILVTFCELQFLNTM